MQEKEISKRAAERVVNFKHNAIRPNSRYGDAILYNTILMGDKHNDIDWATFNLILSKAKFKECSTGIDYLHEFWKNFFPHLNNLVSDWAQVIDNYWRNIDDSDKLLSNIASYIDENKKMKEFMKQNKLTNLYLEWLKAFEDANSK